MVTERLNIRVVTHNGDPITTDRGGTGLRTGYIAGTGAARVFIPIGTTAVIPLAPPAPKHPPYAEVRMVANSYGDCPHCDTYGPHPKVWVHFQEGEKQVHQCGHCRKHLKPWQPESRR